MSLCGRKYTLLRWAATPSTPSPSAVPGRRRQVITPVLLTRDAGCDRWQSGSCCREVAPLNQGSVTDIWSSAELLGGNELHNPFSFGGRDDRVKDKK